MELKKHWAARLDDYAIDLAWSPDGGILAAASSAGPISLFQGADGLRSHDLPGHDQGTNIIAWAPAGSLLASGGQDGAVKFWDAASGQHAATAELGTDWVEHMAWRPPPGPGAAPALLAAATGRKLAVLRADASPAHSFPDAPKTVSALAWQAVAPSRPGDPAAAPVLAASHFGAVRLFDAQSYALRREFAYANGVSALTWSPDGKWLVSGNQDPSVHLWIPAEDDELQMSGYEGKVKHLSFDPTSRWLATAGGRDACVWDCAGRGPEGREPAMLPHETAVSALAFQNTHGLLATASQGGEVHLWSPERRQPLRATARLPDAVTKLAWSPDDRMLAFGSEKGGIYVLKCDA